MSHRVSPLSDTLAEHLQSTHQIHVHLELPELVVHYLGIIHHNVDVIKLGNRCLEGFCGC